MAVVKNSLLNLLGLGLPIVVAIFAIPLLIEALGVESFGILTIIWAVVSYFGLFDLGLGRAVTQQVASAIATDDMTRCRHVVGTSGAIMFALGIIGGLALAVAAPLIASGLVESGEKAGEVVHAFFWMAVAMPAIVLTTGYRGILEALGRFDLVNAVRLPLGIFTYVAPLIVVLAGYTGLDIIAAVLAGGRILAFLIHLILARRVLPAEVGLGVFERSSITPLLKLGGWMSASNTVSPIMNYIDRFIIGFTISAAAVAYYATPQEVVLRVGIIPTAIASVLFPIFASNHATGLSTNNEASLWRYSLFLGALLLPLSATLVVFADFLLATWISPTFAEVAADPLRLMAIAVFFSGVAQVPFAMLQGLGRADITAKIHLVELPIYLALLPVLAMNFGILGAAAAWLARIGLDMVAMFWFCARGIKT